MAQDRARTFDYYLKTKNLKTVLNVQEFCKNRIDEILMLTEALKESPFRGQAFQRLPKHMRRRQMSHHIKRLPRRLRNGTLLSVKFDKSGLPKRPSRKYRRRPSTLLLEYNRRQGKNIWLETHIWHARRFHMTSKWGYSIPEKATNKSFRACYRAMRKHCCITDLSYYSVVELQGKENVLLEGLQQCVSTSCGLTFGAKMFKSGLREGFVTIYHPNSFPYDVIGEVSFLWRPLETENENRTIWIFIHPSFYCEIIDMFKTLFILNSVENPKEAIANVVKSNISDDARKKDAVQKSKARRDFFVPVPEFFNKDRSVIMKLLKNKLNRFRLTGPLSMAVMANAFDVADLNSFKNVPPRKQYSKTSEKKGTNPNPLKRGHSEISDDECDERDENNKIMKMDENFVPESNENYNACWLKFYKNELRKKCLESQAKFYAELSNFLIPSDLPPGMVFSVVVKDPRLTLPTNRMKCIPHNQGSTFLTSLDPSLCYSAIWEEDLREEVSNHQTPTFVINKMRSKFIVPGSDVKEIIKDDKQDKIPVVIIQRSSLNSTNPLTSQDFGSGFDLIIPLGWAMPFWLSLIFRGARSGGLRETNSVVLESKNLNEYIQPDSKAGEFENLERYNRLRSIYFKRPPSSRSNFAKIGTQSPFYFPWKTLLSDWCETEDSQSQRETKFYVLRDLGKLTQLSDILGRAVCKKSSKSKNDMKIFKSLKLEDMNCLVPVFVQSCGKGAPKENAMLCIPTVEDIKEFQQNNICPVENAHVDPNIKTRKALRREHEKLLKSLKRKRKLAKMKKSEEMHHSENKRERTLVGERISSSKDVVEKYKKDMDALWLREPHSIDTLKNSCSKAILGYVVMGGFSFSQANGAGLGYVTLHGLLFLLKMSFKQGVPPLLLFRNNNSVKYRFVSIEICANKRY